MKQNIKQENSIYMANVVGNRFITEITAYQTELRICFGALNDSRCQVRVDQSGRFDRMGV
ncbi:hypothetical protein A5687_03170 [Mycobacterium mantenii]|nr:hypothetical protein A5687_03170 [Mycobacterium mantenii]